ncbi:PREDICTED: mastermind-like domain-containing protein 1 [Bison bison bison]|uniref:Mastermind-like domain-containing protein 1 n=1 Tax=Bison bison bison TaxID=43346 RepID=A0A6P3GE08_BISBB|nr:PREDICTED: mastermind-like domain-containing protein 1 [Bison bison bison]
MDDWKSRLVVKSMLPHFAMVGNRQEPRKLQESEETKGEKGKKYTFSLNGSQEFGDDRHWIYYISFLVPLRTGSHSTAMAAPGHPLLLDNSPRNGSVMGPPFAGPPTAEMGVKGPSIPYYDKTNSAPAVDQELQDLLEELTEIQESSQSELDLEKTLGTKPEEPLVLQHHPPATLGATAKPTVQMPRLESLSSSKDFASSCSLDTGVSLQIPPSSAGFSYAITPASKQMASPSSSTGQAKNAQGTTKRRQEGEDFQLSGMGDEGYPNQIKRPCLEDVTLSMGPGAHPSTACAQLQQPPPFSTQTSILANLMSSTVKHPQGHLMSALPTSNTGPLTPYRPETLSSPSLPQQSFTAQCPLIQGLTTSAHPLCQPQPPASAIYKPKTLSMIMQQDLSSPSPGASEPFPFGHTKPLSHFMSEPGPQKMPSVPTTSRQPALLHYACCQLFSWTSVAGSMEHQLNHHWDPYPIRQHPQPGAVSPSKIREKQRSGLMAMTPEQRSSRIAQRMSQFQAIQDQVISKCSRTKASSPPSQRMIPPRDGLLHSSLSSGMASPIRQQSQETMGMLSPIPCRQQGIFSFRPPFPTPSHLGHNPLGSLGSIDQHMGMPKWTQR